MLKTAVTEVSKNSAEAGNRSYSDDEPVKLRRTGRNAGEDVVPLSTPWGGVPASLL